MFVRRGTSYIDDVEGGYDPGMSSGQPSQDYTRISLDDEDTPVPPDSDGDTPVPVFGTPSQAARANVAELAGQRPPRPHVGFWRNLAAIGMGLGAGYSNAGLAGSRGGGPNVNVRDVVEGVRYGGYNARVNDWQRSVRDADTAAANIEKGEADVRAAAENTSKLGLQGAQSRYYDSWAQQRGQTKTGLLYKPLGAGRYLNTQTGEVIDSRSSIAQRIEESKAIPGWDKLSTAEQTRFIATGTMPAARAPHTPTSGDYLKRKAPDGKIHLYLPDPGDPGNADKFQDVGLAPAENDPMVATNARIDAQDARDARHAGDQDRRTDQRLISDLQAKEQKLHSLRGALGRELSKPDTDDLRDPVTGRPVINAKKQAVKVGAMRQDLQAQYDQATRNAEELQQQQASLSGRHGGRGVPTWSADQIGAPPPVTSPGAPPRSAGPVDPKVKAYADQFFRGDVAAATAAIARQRGKK